MLIPTIKNIYNKEFKVYTKAIEAAITATKEIFGSKVNLNVETQIRNRALQLVSTPEEKELPRPVPKPAKQEAQPYSKKFNE